MFKKVKKSLFQDVLMMFVGNMKSNVCRVAVVAHVFVLADSAMADFKTLKAVDRFVSEGSWQLQSRGKAPAVVKFQKNHTLPDDKAIILGNKKYRFWSVAEHPTEKGKFVLRVHSKKTAGWYSFSWSVGQGAWVSKHWPQVSIKKK